MTKNINGDTYSDVITRSNDNAMPSSSRGGFVPEFIVIHHMATTSFEGGMATWYGGGTSANYAVSDTEIVGCVGENYSAWHAGGTGANDIPNIPNINARSIGIEHVNSTGAPSWQVSDATIRNSSKLVADICKRYNIPITRDRIKRHREITKTQCCGGLDIDKLVKYAQEIANGGQQNNDNSKDELKKEIEMTDGIFKFEDNFDGYFKGDHVYWSSVTGFKYLDNTDQIKVLQLLNPSIKVLPTSKGAPWSSRASQINGTNYGKR